MERTTSAKSVVVASESCNSATATGSHDTSIQAPAATTAPAPYSFEYAKAAVLAFFRQAVEAKGKSAAVREGAYQEDIDDDDDDEWTSDNIYTIIRGVDKAQLAKELRESRKYQVQRWLPQYLNGYNTMEQRYCVWNDDACYWPEKSSGIMWVGVHGADSVCVVTRREHLGTMRLCGSLNDSFVGRVRSLFRKSIICEIEDLEDPSSGLRQKFQKCIKKPFGVVSANLGTNNIEASDYDENKAIEFLKEKMKCVTDFTVYETTKTAIYAFQHLFRKKVKADEIEVSVMDPDCVYVVTEDVKDSDVEDLSVDQIEKYLDDTIGESGLIVMDIPMRSIDDFGHLLKKPKTSHETYLPSPGGSSNMPV